jgi:D-alanine-D-alanine ligase
MRYARRVASSVVLLFGGVSSERRVSVASAQNLCQAMPAAAPWFIAPDGSVHDLPRAALLAHERPFELDFQPAASARWTSIAAALDDAAKTTVYLLALHGGEGENGELQRDFERRRLAFTGSGSVASELAFDKARAKSAVARHGLCVAAETRLQGSEAQVRADLTAALRRHGRLVVKPLADGSSIGLHHVHDELAIPAVAREVASTGRPYLAEEFLQGTELTVGVIDEAGSSLSLPPSEVRVEPGGAFDFAGKYLGRGTRELTPAEVSPEVALAARAAALTAHRALGCAGYSRTDLIAGARGILFLETNTLPGLTRMSFIPQQLAAAGRTIERFVQAQLELAELRRDQTP